MGLNLELTKASSLDGALKHFTEPEILERENAYKCPKCKKPVPARKQFTIHRAPAILVIQLKRFTWTGSKISKKITFPLELDLSPYLTENNVITPEQVREAMKLKASMPSREKQLQVLKRSLSASNLDAGKRNSSPDSQYELYGVLVHLGGGCHSGHYICYVRAANQIWHRMDDSYVQKVSVGEVLGQSDAYMLFYRRKSAPAEAPVEAPAPKSVTPPSPVTPSIAPKTIEVPAVASEKSQQQPQQQPKAQKQQQQQKQMESPKKQKQQEQQHQKPQKSQEQQQQKPKQAAPPVLQAAKAKPAPPVADDSSDESDDSDESSSSSSSESSSASSSSSSSSISSSPSAGLQKEKKHMLAIAKLVQPTSNNGVQQTTTTTKKNKKNATVQVLATISDDESDDEIISKMAPAPASKTKELSKPASTKPATPPVRPEAATMHLLTSGFRPPEPDKDEIDLETILGQMEKKAAPKPQSSTQQHQQPQKKRKREDGEAPAEAAASPAKKVKKVEQPAKAKPTTSAQDLNRMFFNHTFASSGSTPSLFGQTRVTSWAAEGGNAAANGASYESSLRTQLLVAEEAVSTTGIKKRMRDEWDADYDRGKQAKRRKKESEEEQSNRKHIAALFQKVSDKNVKKRNDEIARERKSFKKFDHKRTWQKKHKHSIKERKRSKNL